MRKKQERERICELGYLVTFMRNSHFVKVLREKDYMWLVQCGEVVMNTCLAGLHEVGEHDNGDSVLFPDHLPQVGHCLLQGTLC